MEEKKEKWTLWPNCPLQGCHGDWVGVRGMRLKEMREHNVQFPVCHLLQYKLNLLSPNFISIPPFPGSSSSNVRNLKIYNT